MMSTLIALSAPGATVLLTILGYVLGRRGRSLELRKAEAEVEALEVETAARVVLLVRGELDGLRIEVRRLTSHVDALEEVLRSNGLPIPPRPPMPPEVPTV